jgi:hypothetical protein
MSYYKLQGMSIDKDGKIYVRVASNNVTPKDYERTLYTGTINDFVYDLMGGMIQPTPSANDGKIMYIKNMMYAEIGNMSMEQVKTSPKVAVVFKQLWRDSKASEMYIVKINDNYVTEKTRNGIRYTPYKEGAKEFNFYRASNMVFDFPRYDLKLIKK